MARRLLHPAARPLPLSASASASLSSKSKAYMRRHVRDKFVRQAKAEGTRSRSSFKLQQINKKHGVIASSARRVLDLGSNPGGWSIVAADLLRAHSKSARLVACDLLPMEPVAGCARFVQGDFTEPAVQVEIVEALQGHADVVLSDMAPNTSGHGDHERSVALCRAVLDFCHDVLSTPSGVLLCKVFAGAEERELVADMRACFSSVKHVKPPASRASSREYYLLAKGYHAGHSS